MNKSKQTTEVTPWAPAQPYILKGLQSTSATFDQNQPALQGYAADFYNAYGRAAPGAEQGINLAQRRTNSVLAGDAAGRNPGATAYAAAMTPRATNDYKGAVQPSLNYYSNVMGGGFLNSNPWLDSAVGYAIDDATNATNAQFSMGGRYGSDTHAGAIAREAGRISSNARMAAYDAERARMDAAAGNYGSMGLSALGADEQARAAASNDALQAAGMADNAYYIDQNRMDQAVGQAQDLRSGNLGLLGNAAQLPWLGVQAQNGGVTQLSSPYSTRTTTQSAGLGNTLLGLGGGALSAAGSVGGFGKLFSDPRLKKDVKPLGVRPDGLGVYAFKYRGGTGLPKGEQVGVMADEVAAARPDALGPTVGGYQTVDYDKLGGATGADMGPGMGGKSIALPDAKPSFGQRLDRVLGNAVNPDMSRPGAGLSLLGAAIMAGAEGTPFAGIGRGLLAAREAAAERQDKQRQFDIQERNADALGALRQAQLGRVGVQRFQRRDGSVVEVDADGNVTSLVDALPNNEPVIPVSDGKGGGVYVPRSQAPGKAPYRPPPRAGMGGGRVGMSGGIPVITSPAQFAALPSGATFKAPDGTVRRKP